MKHKTKVNWIKRYQTNVKSIFEVENLHSIPRVRKLATHGSHENTKEKEKTGSWPQRLPPKSPTSDRW